MQFWNSSLMECPSLERRRERSTRGPLEGSPLTTEREARPTAAAQWPTEPATLCCTLSSGEPLVIIAPSSLSTLSWT